MAGSMKSTSHCLDLLSRINKKRSTPSRDEHPRLAPTSLRWILAPRDKGDSRRSVNLSTVRLIRHTHAQATFYFQSNTYYAPQGQEEETTNESVHLG